MQALISNTIGWFNSLQNPSQMRIHTHSFFVPSKVSNVCLTKKKNKKKSNANAAKSTMLSIILNLFHFVRWMVIVRNGCTLMRCCCSTPYIRFSFYFVCLFGSSNSPHHKKRKTERERGRDKPLYKTIFPMGYMKCMSCFNYMTRCLLLMLPSSLRSWLLLLFLLLFILQLGLAERMFLLFFFFFTRITINLQNNDTCALVIYWIYVYKTNCACARLW